ncbi:hypothetical protein WA026_022832 [Henosepilachna vigintioctopunctata]|uniref:Uncharacterized protein n=1 Tax=Henosepilachna vigintioctopunctata TaxID=420089 RepID=A0AAW1V2Y9_9CUCU
MTFGDVRTPNIFYILENRFFLPVIFYEFFVILSIFAFIFLVFCGEFCLFILRNWSILSYSFVANGQLNTFFGISQFSLAHQLSTYDIFYAVSGQLLYHLRMQ